MPTYWASYLCVAGEMPPDPAHAFVQATYLNPMGCTATPNVYMKATYIVDVCSSGGTGGMLSSCNATGFTFSTCVRVAITRTQSKSYTVHVASVTSRTTTLH